jgi:hypothetical protein
VIRRLASPKGTGRAVQPGHRSVGDAKYSTIVGKHLAERAAGEHREEWLPPRPWRMHQRLDGSLKVVDADGVDLRWTTAVKRLMVERVNAGEPEPE